MMKKIAETATTTTTTNLTNLATATVYPGVMPGEDTLQGTTTPNATTGFSPGVDATTGFIPSVAATAADNAATAVTGDAVSVDVPAGGGSLTAGFDLLVSVAGSVAEGGQSAAASVGVADAVDLPTTNDDLRFHQLHAARIIADVAGNQPQLEDIVEAEAEGDADEEEFELRIDPESIMVDLLEEAVDDDRHLRLREQYIAEKAALVGKTIRVKPSNSRESVNWKVISNVSNSQSVFQNEFEEVGVKDFDFANTTEWHKRNKRTNFLDLLIHLWPGDWREQLRRLNLRIRLDNRVKKQAGRMRYPRLIKEISENEFWIFWGIMLSARTYGRKGGNLWDKEEPEGEDVMINMTKHMSSARHKDIKRYVAFLFADESLKETDPWWQITRGVEEFNKN